MKTYQRIYNLVKKIPKGRVATYGQIGQMLDLNPRVIGWALNRLAKYKPNYSRANHVSVRTIPWQRVINSKGSISTNKLMNIPLGLQKKLLEKEGIKFNKEEKINLKKYLWKSLS
ncbi:MAG: MGMT family protein [Candidatus Melainabacteria bacterium]|nr:MGMT family protein [Candidatus Melainabacteria bacterium]